MCVLVAGEICVSSRRNIVGRSSVKLKHVQISFDDRYSIPIGGFAFSRGSRVDWLLCMDEWPGHGCMGEASNGWLHWI